MTQFRRRLDRILSPEYMADLKSVGLPDLRTMRAETGEEEALLSYERRVIHGRVAIIEAELDRRAGGATGSLVDRLKDILSDGTVGGTRGGGNLHDPKIEFDRPNRPTTKVAMDDTLTVMDDLSEDQLRERLAAHKDAEKQVSETRRKVLDTLDTLNEELGRRYASGEASPDDALKG
jgi:hypothetical protein